MNILISLLSALILAVVGAVSLGVLADRWTVWFRVSNFEGAAGYFVLMFIVVGAIGGFVIGLACALYAIQGGNARFLVGLRLGASWVIGIVAVLAVTTYFLADHPPRLNGQPLLLDVEIRPASGAKMTASPDFKSTVTIENGLGKTTSWTQVPWDSPKEEAGQQILPFTLGLSSSSAHRTMLIQWTDDAWLTLAMPLRSKPTEADLDWSPWMETRFQNTSPSESSPSRPPQLRYRVRVPPPAPPQPTEAELASKREAAMASQLAALPAEAKIEERLPFTRFGVKDELQSAALNGIRSRSTFDTEFAALVIDDRAELAAEALRLVPRLPGPAQPLLGPVGAAGQDIHRRLERALGITEAEDPAYEWAAEISVRFSGWITAVFYLREQAGGDFAPELRAILLAARQRPDSQALRRDVVRVASFHLHEWTGEAPLPTDPPPR